MRDIVELLIDCAIKAPSGHNTQPWKFAYRKNVIKLFPDYKRRLPVADHDDHALFISLGCAVENLVVAANHFGYQAAIDCFPPYGHNECICIRLIEGKTDADSRLFEAISKRQSTRNRYNGHKIPAEDIKALQSAVHYEGVRSLVFEGQQEIIPLIEFVKEASLMQFSDKAFRNELVYWIRFNAKEAENTRDGLHGAVMGSPSIPRWLGKWIFGLTGPSAEAKKAEKLMKSSSAMIVFIADADNKLNWINLGRAFERVALTATALDIKHAHLNMPCEEIEIRKKFAAYLGLSGAQQPLLFIRLGYSEFMPYSLRRPLDQVIYEDRAGAMECFELEDEEVRPAKQ